MLEFLGSLPIWLLALIMGFYCFFCTSVGAFLVYFCKNLNKKYMSAILAFAGGIMLASSFFSLLMPAIDSCQNIQWKELVFVLGGFIFGSLFVLFVNMHFDKKFSSGVRNKDLKRRSMLIVASITFHNVPEGMAIGVAIGSIAVMGNAELLPAIMLCIGIGIQNIPEGLSVALPLKHDGKTPAKACLTGVLSGTPEPICAVLACLLSVFVSSIMPLCLAFAAGAMILVAITELIPESLIQNKSLGTIFFVLGFCIMAVLDMML